MAHAIVSGDVGNVAVDSNNALSTAVAGTLVSVGVGNINSSVTAGPDATFDANNEFVHYCKSMEDELLPLTLADIKCNKTLQNCIEDCGGAELDPAVALPVPYSSALLRKVLQFTLLHGTEPEKTTEEFATWKTTPLPDRDVEFVGDDIMFHRDLLLVANYLDNKRLLDVLAKRMAERIVGKTPDEIKALFQSNETMTLQDVQRLRADHPWVVAHGQQAEVSSDSPHEAVTDSYADEVDE